MDPEQVRADLGEPEAVLGAVRVEVERGPDQEDLAQARVDRGVALAPASVAVPEEAVQARVLGMVLAAAAEPVRDQVQAPVVGLGAVLEVDQA